MIFLSVTFYFLLTLIMNFSHQIIQDLLPKICKITALKTPFEAVEIFGTCIPLRFGFCVKYDLLPGIVIPIDGDSVVEKNWINKLYPQGDTNYYGCSMFSKETIGLTYSVSLTLQEILNFDKEDDDKSRLNELAKDLEFIRTTLINKFKENELVIVDSKLSFFSIKNCFLLEPEFAINDNENYNFDVDDFTDEDLKNEEFLKKEKISILSDKFIFKEF